MVDELICSDVVSVVDIAVLVDVTAET